MRRILATHWPIVILGFLFGGLCLLPSVAAFAQDLPTPAPNNPNAPSLVEWSLIASIVLGGILKALSPSNTALPPELSPTVLHVINIAGTAATTILLAIVGGTPWIQAIAAGALPFFVGFIQVGAAKGTWLGILENALLPLARRAKAGKMLGRAVPVSGGPDDPRAVPVTP